MRISKIVEAVELLMVDGGLKYYLSDPSRFSIAAYKIAKRIDRIAQDIDMVVDVGSNIGQFLTTFRCLYPEAIFYCFEPDNDSFVELQKKANKMRGVNVNNCALSNEIGEITFYRHPYSLINSALDVAIDNSHPNYKGSIPEIAKVPTTTLDSIESNFPTAKDILLKLDVQGLELKVLEGATNFLTRVRYVLLEIAFSELYSNQPSFKDINSLLTDFGFDFSAVLDFHTGSELEIIEIDALYVNHHLN